MNSAYLGDGVYVSWNGFQFEIRVNSMFSQPVVYLEVGVMNELIRYRNLLMKMEYGVDPTEDDDE